MNKNDDFLWCERYRPNTIEECVLTPALKKTFQQFVEKKEIPNLLLSGSSGVGKTSVAKAMLNELGFDSMIINGSMNGNIDTLRNDISQFASSRSFSGGRKYVILDESDFLNPTSTQPGLRNFMEEFSNNCGFILTCNYKNRILPALHSRCSVIDFSFTKKELQKLAGDFMKRLCKILENENVTYDKAVIAELIKKQFPDWRAIINKCQEYAIAYGSIDTGVLATANSSFDVAMKELIGYLRESKFNDMRKWIGENSNIEPHIIYQKLYDNCSSLCTPRGAAQMILTIGEYQAKEPFVVNKEINTVACLVEIMGGVEWKNT